MTVSIEILGRDRLALAAKKARQARQGIHEAVKRSSKDFMNDVVARARRDYLTGPRPRRLGVVTNRLRSSIRGRVEDRKDRISVRVGTDVPYAPAHEFGFVGGVSVPTHKRVIRQVFGRRINPVTVQVSAHTRNVDLDQRAFMRPAVEDALPAYQEDLIGILERAARGILGE